ncbi:protein prenyltransferase alpha subunit repeat-containing protein 1 [Lampris incognitus]|uniref:protein prenyltransferase alpha subunit repeat-containing protein 1 n=1 Tax=Lampris incognitus TaxID=2546036 RepID=UPI0024B59832|nr:protein prenyltransferase alpha subunit repeat-containing protein 1 [Lampris incognitus]
MAELEVEADVLVQRVVKDISNAFKRNPNIDEIGLIPCPEARYNRSPIVLVENKLGVESWCVKFLLPYVHNKVLLYRQRKHWLDREALVDITCTLLLLNPEFTTAWNIRKELLQCGVLNPKRDLYLGKLVLTKFPKSPETWIHRRWVLQKILSECFPREDYRKEHKVADQCDAAALTESDQRLYDHQAKTLHEEMKVCSDAACRYPSNYNAWSHRIWVLEHMAKGNIKVLHDELSSMRLWVSMHVSDHSGFHYRQFLLKALTTELSQSLDSTTIAQPQHQTGEVPRKHPHHHTVLSFNRETSEAAEADEVEQQSAAHSVLKIFQQEMELCTDLIQSFPGHETLWCHRRHVFYLWHQWKKEHYCCIGNGSSDSSHLNHTDPGLSSHPYTVFSEGSGRDCSIRADTMSGQPNASEVMEVDVLALPFPHDTKRLKRNLLAPCFPALPSEHTFLSGLLEGCCSLEQRHFALAYKKWLNTVIGQYP